MMIFFCASHSGLVDFQDAQEFEPRPARRRPEHEFARLSLLDRSDARRVPGIGDIRRAGRIADPVELARIELNALRSDGLCRHHVRHDHVQRGAVARRDGRKPIGRVNAAGAGHVARDDRRLARDVPAHMPRDEPAAVVIIVARRSADNEIDGLAAIKVRYRVGLRGQDREPNQGCERNHDGLGRDCDHPSLLDGQKTETAEKTVSYPRPV
jgi:hypothetical protein